MRNTVGNNQPYLDQISGDIRGHLPQLGQMAFGDNPLLNSANSYAMDTLGGKYLDQQNPYLQGMINSTANDVQDRVNSLFGRVGGSLGTPHAKVLSSELANAENSLRYGNYAAERQNQQGTASMIPGLNASQYAGIAPYLAAGQTAGTLPYAGLGALSPIIGLAGGAGQQSGTVPGGWGTDLLNAAASVAAGAASAGAFASDRRLKKNIVKTGTRSDGLNTYEWVYRNDPTATVQAGFMADEVKEIYPEAHIENFNGTGYAGVNYALIPHEVAA